MGFGYITLHKTDSYPSEILKTNASNLSSLGQSMLDVFTLAHVQIVHILIVLSSVYIKPIPTVLIVTVACMHVSACQQPKIIMHSVCSRLR